MDISESDVSVWDWIRACVEVSLCKVVYSTESSFIILLDILAFVIIIINNSSSSFDWFRT